MIKLATFSVLTSFMIATAASPCGFHNYAPQPSLTDKLLGSNDIILARSTPDAPFKFVALTTLEGAQGDIDIPFLVDTITRKKFELNANATVLFARDDNYGPWQRLAFVDASMSPILTAIMERLPKWEMGDYLDRFEYFATLVGHEDERIHKLALLELDQADYSTLRDLQLEVDPTRLIAQLNSPYESQFKAIRILLLGLSGAEEARQYLEMNLEKSVGNEDQYLGAYSTALIELVGPEAVEEITSRYLADHRVSRLSHESLVEAIALHGQTGEVAMADTIASAIENALWIDPSLAGAVARQFGFRNDWSHYASLRNLQIDGSIFVQADQRDVADYLRFAKHAETKP